MNSIHYALLSTVTRAEGIWEEDLLIGWKKVPTSGQIFILPPPFFSPSSLLPPCQVWAFSRHSVNRSYTPTGMTLFLNHSFPFLSFILEVFSFFLLCFLVKHTVLLLKRSTDNMSTKAVAINLTNRHNGLYLRDNTVAGVMAVSSALSVLCRALKLYPIWDHTVWDRK